MAKSKKTIIPPSLQPRKKTKKAIPGSTTGSTKKETPAKPKAKKPAIVEAETVDTPIPVVAKQTLIETPPKPKIEKKRFTLWLENDTYRAFKIHVAMSGGSASDYIESLIKRDLSL